MAYSCKAKILPTRTSFGVGVLRGSDPPGSVIATNTDAFLVASDKEPGAATVTTRGERERSPTSRAAYPRFRENIAHDKVGILTQGVFPFGAVTLTIEYATTRDFGSDVSFQSTSE